MSDQYTRLFQNAGSMLYNNVSYYATKIQEIIVEISKINETILLLRRRIIKMELDIQQNMIKYDRLKVEFDKLKVEFNLKK